MPLKGEDIRALREKAHLSQTVLARYLNLTVGYVSQLECGTKHRPALPWCCWTLFIASGLIGFWRSKSNRIKLAT